MSYIFETIIQEENLKPKYKMNVITKDGINYEELYFTSLTDFKYFLDSIHYDRITNRTDDRIIVVNIKTDEIVFDSDKGD